nr:hypothetical protein [uncultured Enterobacter sp.]
MYIPVTLHIINYLPDVNQIEDLTIFKSLGFIEFHYKSHWLRVELAGQGERVAVFERIVHQSVVNAFTQEIEALLNKVPVS